jgi:membrane-anchored protein YejM (alkaline phosphatase superfamily)
VSMSHHRISRRDFLKILGTTGLFAPVFNFPGNTEGGQGSFQSRKSPAGPNIIILIFDAMSARHMSLFGYQRNTTPNIDKFAKTSTTFHQHHAVSNYTKPSTASLFTGVYPWSHRDMGYYTSLLNYFDDINMFKETKSKLYTLAFTHNIFAMTVLQQLSSDIDLLKPVQDLAIYDANKFLEIFKTDYSMGLYASEEWSVGGAAGPSYSLFINPILDIVKTLSFSKIEQMYKKTYPLGLVDNKFGKLFRLEDAIDWIIQCSTSVPQPYFGYFHLFPPHEPYAPREDFVNAFLGDNIYRVEKPESYFTQHYTQNQLNQFCDLYDRYLAYADSEFGRLLGILEKNGVLDNTYLILTSDHGQMFERGIHGHIITLYEPVIHIPLIFHAPGQVQGKDIYSPTSNTDVLPTILQLINRNLPTWLEGRPLPIDAQSQDPGRIIFSMDAKENNKMKPLTKAAFSAIQWPYKLNNYRGYPGYDNIDELFDLSNDPDELNNLAASHPAVVVDLKNELRKNQVIAEKKYIGFSVNQE